MTRGLGIWACDEVMSLLARLQAHGCGPTTYSMRAAVGVLGIFHLGHQLCSTAPTPVTIATALSRSIHSLQLEYVQCRRAA